MAPAGKKGAHEEEPFQQTTNRRHPEESRPGAGDGSREEARVSEQAIYTWRKRLGTLQPADIKRLRQLEIENAKLEKIVAERDLEIETMKEINRRKVVSSQPRREQVALACERGHSERRACELMALPVPDWNIGRCASSAMRRRWRRCGGLPRAIRAMATGGFACFLRREGHPMSRHRAHRLWRLAGLQLPRRTSRRRAAASRPRPLPAVGPNHVWAYDSVFDACANGQQLKCLTVIDEFTRECLAIDVAGSIRSRRVIEVLARLISERGALGYPRSDNGPEFVSRAILEWLADQKIDTALNDPGKPWQNGADESFNGKFRDECLAIEWFRSRDEARVVIETWRRHYNAERPHQSLKDLTPLEFKARCDSINQGAALKQ